MLFRSATTGTVITLPVEELTRKAFAEFGDVLSPDELERLPINLYGGTMDCYRAGPFEADGPVEFLVTRYQKRELRVHFLERHLLLTQTFIVFGGPMVFVVAPPDAPLQNDFPELSTARAFLLPTNGAVNIHRRTWHEPPFPLVDGTVTVATNHQAVTAGLTSVPNEFGEIDAGDVDKRSVTHRTGYELRVALA